MVDALRPGTPRRWDPGGQNGVHADFWKEQPRAVVLEQASCVGLGGAGP